MPGGRWGASAASRLASFSSPVFKQVVFACAGIAAMLIVSKIDYHYLTHYAWALYGLSIVSLVAILVIGQSAYGSTRWFDLGPVQIQPSEFAKLATILALARYFSEHGGDASGRARRQHDEGRHCPASPAPIW